MRALTYQGAKDVRVETVPDPAIIAADDIILRATATAICGSDLHIYRGKIPGMEDGDILGHEFMGIVEDAGPEVDRVKKGDRVVVPFVIACGQCFHCLLDEFSACETTNTGRGAAMNAKAIKPPAALFGYSHLYGGVPGGQAELVRVPKANVGPLPVPDTLGDEQVLFLSDILPTGYQAVVNAGVKPGSTGARTLAATIERSIGIAPMLPPPARCHCRRMLAGDSSLHRADAGIVRATGFKPDDESMSRHPRRPNARHAWRRLHRMVTLRIATIDVASRCGRQWSPAFVPVLPAGNPHGVTGDDPAWRRASFT